MEKLNVILENGIDTEVNSLFYLYNSKYYFIYTIKEIDENGYVILYLSQIGKEVSNTPNGPVETGYMIGAEITDPEEWKQAQVSISKIVETAKTKVADPSIQVLPLSMLSKLKITGKKKFRLLKDIVKKDLDVEFGESLEEPTHEVVSAQENIVVDYRSKLFEEQQKNEELTKQVEQLTNKINEIQKIISENN